MMKTLFLLSATALLIACQPSDNDANDPPEGLDIETETAPLTIGNAVLKDGKVTVVLQQPVSEPRACIVPIRVENGLDGKVSVTMIGFSVTGPGEATQGNMFAPVAASGTASEARVILEGQSCDAYKTISVPDVLCKMGETDCSDKVEFEDGGGLSFSQAG